MTATSLHVFRRVFGFVIALVGLAAIAADFLVAFQERGAVHITHQIIGAVMLFVGGWCLNPPDAEAIADAILKRVPLVAGLWPGGKRAADPPAEPGVPLPPSVTHEDR
jgi:hypothetical protein